MKKDDRLNLLTLFIIIFATICFRYYFSEKQSCGFSFDSGSYALATQNYSIADDRPHLPGYFLHIQEIRIVSYFTGDPYSAMVWISIIYSALAAGLLFSLLKKYFSNFDRLAITLLVIANPFVSFFGSISEIYSVDLFFSILILYLGIHKRLIFLMPIALAIAAGIRQSTGALLLPLYFFLIYLDIKDDKKRFIKHVFSNIIGLFFILAWFVPMLQSVGGLSEYLTLFRTNSPITPKKNFATMITFFSYLFWLGLPIVYMLTLHFFTKRNQNPSSQEYAIPKEFKQALIVWVAPIILIFMFFAYDKGYLMINAAGIILMSYQIIENNRYKKAIAVSTIALSIIIFVFSPVIQTPISTILSSKSRHETLANVTIARVFSSYSCSANSIKEFSANHKYIDSLINNSPELNNKYCLVDPCSPISIRNLQYLYPSVHFYIMTKSDSGLAIEYYDNKQIMRNVSDLIDSSFVISRKDFVEEYLRSKFDFRYKSSGSIALGKINSGEPKLLAKYYSELFAK